MSAFFTIKMITISEILNKYNREEALLILEKILKEPINDLFDLLNVKLTENQIQQYLKIEEQLEFQPLQYIVNFTYFYNRKFFVDSNVLIPRWDSEILIESVIDLYKNGPLLEIGVGSGALSSTLSLELKTEVDGVDISEKALEIARKNSKDLKAKTNFWQSDLFSNVTKRYEIIFSNPPYIKKDILEELDFKVRKEPVLALDGGIDGLKFYRKIIKECPNYLKKNGFLVLEIGYDQKDEVLKLMKDSGFQNLTFKKDLNHLDRLIIGQYV